MRQILLDTETTGLNPKEGHKIVEIGCLEMIDRELTGNKFHTYLDPERDIDAEATQITGLTREFLQGKPKFSHIVEEFLNFIIDAELIIHNASFDLSFINHELNLLNHPITRINDRVIIFDTLYHARKMFPGKKNNLDALCARFNVDNSNREYHGALLDAQLLAEVYLALTRGQTSFSWQGDNQASTDINNVNEMETKKLVHDLPILYATAEEIDLHMQYLIAIQAVSK